MAGAAAGNGLVVAGVVAGNGLVVAEAVAGVAGVVAGVVAGNRPIGRLGIVDINVGGLADRLAVGCWEWLEVPPGEVAGVGEALTAGLLEDRADGEAGPEQAEIAAKASTIMAPQPMTVNLAPVLAMVARIVTDPPQAPGGGSGFSVQHR